MWGLLRDSSSLRQPLRALGFFAFLRPCWGAAEGFLRALGTALAALALPGDFRAGLAAGLATGFLALPAAAFRPVDTLPASPEAFLAPGTGRNAASASARPIAASTSPIEAMP